MGNIRQTQTVSEVDRLAILANHHFDSRRWQAIRFRSDDIVISSWAKSGTTWLQQIVCQMIHDGRSDLATNSISPWVDFRLTPLADVVELLESQPFRRVMKSHLPSDAIPIVPPVRYLYIARHPIDVIWSWYNHHVNFTDETYEALNGTIGRVGPPLERPDVNFRRYFRKWLLEDGHPFHPYWSNVDSWWRHRHRPNVCIVHFADLRRHFEYEVMRLASFLNIRPTADVWPRVFSHSRIDYVREHAELIVPFGGTIFKGGARSFVRSGAARQWEGLLKKSDEIECRVMADKLLTPGCSDWLFRQGDRPIASERAVSSTPARINVGYEAARHRCVEVSE
jgi:aryl sulfotransferase